MDTALGTVNFEDLFDFSPEPLERPPSVPTSVAAVDVPTTILASPVLTALQRGGDGSRLSQSVPNSWGGEVASSLPAAELTTTGSAEDVRTKGKRGRKPGQRNNLKTDMKSKLERSRQSARECRARKKLR